MRRSILYYFALMALLCVSCYEGEDLVQKYESYGQSQSLVIEDATGVTLTSAKVKVELSNPKYESQIDFYYSDQPDVDLVAKGERQSFVVGDANQIIASGTQFTLTDLMPDTQYRYVAVYTDVSGKTVKTEERSLRTIGFKMYSSLRYQTFFACHVYTSFDNLITGAEPGYIYGIQRNLTHENAEGDVAVALDYPGTASCYEPINGLMPDTEYYLRPYVRYRDHIYYGSVDNDHTPKIEVNFLNFETRIINNRQVRLSVTARLQNLPYNSDYVMPELEYGMLVSEHQGVTYDNATRHIVEPNWLGGITYEMNDVIPSKNYYARGFIRWQDQVLLSDEFSFVTPKGELQGDVDSLYINGQMIRFILVKAGTFTMGATDEQQAYARDDEYPAHEVTISDDFYISEVEITKAMIEGTDDLMPARRSHNGAIDFANYVSLITGIADVSIPTEAEWEYAARGGHLHPEQTLFAGSDNPDEVAWVIDDPLSEGYYGYELPKVNQGGKKLPNVLGLYDMSGNVAEWVLDAYQTNYYSNSPANDPCCTIDEWAQNGVYDRTQQYVIRGGGARSEWAEMSLIDYRVSARRFTNGAEAAFGFRLVIRNN